MSSMYIVCIATYRVVDCDQGLVCFSLGRDDSDVATGVNHAVASSSTLSEPICNLVIPKWPL